MDIMNSESQDEEKCSYSCCYHVYTIFSEDTWFSEDCSTVLFICRLVLFLLTATVCPSKNLVIPTKHSERSLSLVLAHRLIILSIAVISQRLRFWGSTSSYLCGLFFPSYCSDPFFSYTKLNEVVMRWALDLS